MMKSNMTAPFSIMCFSWNAAGLRLCETMSQPKADAARKGFRALVTFKKPCIAPDFFEEIRGIIRSKQPGLVVITTQDEDSIDTYFHSDLLTKSMPEIGYSLLKRDKLDDIGEIASGAEQVKVKTGKPSGSALRISIYASNEFFPEFKLQEKAISKFFSDNGQIQSTCHQDDRASGAIASYVWHPVYGKFVFIATHLPSGVNNLKLGKTLDYTSYRVASKAANILCLIRIMNKVVDALPSESKPDHVFLLGDLNYDIVVPNKTNMQVVTDLGANLTAAKLKELQKNDELQKALDEPPLDGFKEGISNEGPLFMPTWRLARGRSDNCAPEINGKFTTACFGEPGKYLGGIGWHDRILYKETLVSHYIAQCTEYNRLDVKNMHESTNAGVMAFFRMELVT